MDTTIALTAEKISPFLSSRLAKRALFLTLLEVYLALQKGPSERDATKELSLG